MEELLSTTTEKQECCQLVMGPNEEKLSNIGFGDLSSTPQNKHPMITLVDNTHLSLLSGVSAYKENQSFHFWGKFGNNKYFLSRGLQLFRMCVLFFISICPALILASR